MSSFDLKLAAIILMFIDHLGYVFFPTQSVFRLVGRLAFPIFAFQIGIGYRHTKNKEKHILLLLFFAIISQIPFLLMTNVHMPITTLNILFTFIFALLVIYCNDNIKNLIIKIPLITILLLLAFYIKVDYGLLGIILTIVLHYCSPNKIATAISLASICTIDCLIDNSFSQAYAILAVIFLWLFDGQKGPSAKWLFYIFYPAHMLFLWSTYKLL